MPSKRLKQTDTNKKVIQPKEKRAGCVYDLNGQLVVCGLLSDEIEKQIEDGLLILATEF